MEEEKELFHEYIGITFSEPIAEPLNFSVASLDGSSRVILAEQQNEVPYPYEEPLPFEVPLPFEEIPFDEPSSEATESFYIERPADIPLSFECFVQKQASYGLLDGKYLIRY